MKPSIRNLSLACAALGSLASLHAADVSQIANSALNWNDAAYWGSAATGGNDYFSTSFQGSGSLVTAMVTNETTWQYTNGGTAPDPLAIGTVRDNLTGSGSFAGNSLTLATNTRLLGKVQDGGTSTVNLVFAGGFYFSGVNAGNGSGILDGSISFASGTNLGAIGLNPNGDTGGGNPMVLTVSSTVLGDSSDTLQLTLFSEVGSTRLGQLIFNGDITGFGGTLYVGTSASGTNVDSFYSIQSSSVSTTLHLDYEAGNNFRYDMAGADTTFGAVQLGASLLTPGTYDAAALNGLTTLGTEFFGTGTITVVPEPSVAILLGAAGVFALVARVRRKRIA